jgi:hypothetical protein
VQVLYGKATKKALQFKNHFYLERGPYDLIAVMDESVSAQPYVAKGLFVDLYDPTLPVCKEKTVEPGTQAFLYNVKRVDDKNRPQVLASASRIYNESVESGSYSFVTKSPVNTTNVMRVLLPAKPTSCEIKGPDGALLHDAAWSSWDADSNTCLITHENYPDGVSVKLIW